MGSTCRRGRVGDCTLVCWGKGREVREGLGSNVRFSRNHSPFALMVMTMVVVRVVVVVVVVMKVMVVSVSCV